MAFFFASFRPFGRFGLGLINLVDRSRGWFPGSNETPWRNAVEDATRALPIIGHHRVYTISRATQRNQVTCERIDSNNVLRWESPRWFGRVV